MTKFGLYLAEEGLCILTGHRRGASTLSVFRERLDTLTKYCVVGDPLGKRLTLVMGLVRLVHG